MENSPTAQSPAVNECVWLNAAISSVLVAWQGHNVMAAKLWLLRLMLGASQFGDMLGNAVVKLE
jgi:hypothetical protein